MSAMEKPVRVLVVEDEETARCVTVTALRLGSFDVLLNDQLTTGSSVVVAGESSQDDSIAAASVSESLGRGRSGGFPAGLSGAATGGG